MLYYTRLQQQVRPSEINTFLGNEKYFYSKGEAFNFFENPFPPPPPNPIIPTRKKMSTDFDMWI
jgi:hypothetical protein